jgi:hypothetical protein
MVVKEGANRMPVIFISQSIGESVGAVFIPGSDKIVVSQ